MGDVVLFIRAAGALKPEPLVPVLELCLRVEVDMKTGRQLSASLDRSSHEFGGVSASARRLSGGHAPDPHRRVVPKDSKGRHDRAVLLTPEKFSAGLDVAPVHFGIGGFLFDDEDAHAQPEDAIQGEGIDFGHGGAAEFRHLPTVSRRHGRVARRLLEMGRRGHRVSSNRLITARSIARWALAAALTATGVGHLTWGRRGFRITVPDWATRLLRLDKDAIVVASGVVELALAAALVALPKERTRVGWAVAAFFVAVFPGNVHQWRTGRSAPMLDTDRRRLIRLFLQPLLVLWALWSTGSRSRRR